jgi:hypothetical protein
MQRVTLHYRNQPSITNQKIQITPQQITKYCNIQAGWFDLDEALIQSDALSALSHWLNAFKLLTMEFTIQGPSRNK